MQGFNRLEEFFHPAIHLVELFFDAAVQPIEIAPRHSETFIGLRGLPPRSRCIRQDSYPADSAKGPPP